MKKLLFPIFYPRFAAFVVALAIFLYLSGAAGAVELKRNSIIEGSVITLGDIFYDLPRNADKVLGPAPRPGSEMVLNARTLLRVATAMDVEWRPSSGADHIVLQRSATIIGKDQIEPALSAAIKEAGYAGDFDLALPVQTTEIILPSSQPATFELSDITLDAKNGRFSALVSAPSLSDPIQTLRLSGAIHQVTQVPVLKNAMRNGSIIKASDIEYMKMRTSALNHDVILDSETLVGMTPRRMVVNAAPLTDNDISAPQVVQRGQSITMIFNNGTLELTAQGKALENGAKGDIIRVVNANSNRTIQATVSGEKEVRIRSF